MNWAKVVHRLGEMHGRHLVAADSHPDPHYRDEHRRRATMADVLQEALLSGLSADELADLENLNESN